MEKQGWLVQVYTKGPGGRRIWEGILPTVPRKGEGIKIKEGHGEEIVGRVVYDLKNQSVKMTIESADADNQYPEINYNKAW